jgi:RHS repeat-associated protein
MGRLTASQQITDGEIYGFGYSYNLSGALIEETYPSGRVVRNTLNADGEMAQVESKKNASDFFRPYASHFSYNSAGAVTAMKLGNGRWETAEYNERLQITQIGLGSGPTSQNLLKLEFKYNTPNLIDNNGSMREQKITVPTVGTNAGFTAVQTYVYDSLNRIQSATENINGNPVPSWKQVFDIDRYGNRRFDAGNTTTIANCDASVCNPEINTSDNRLKKDQVGGTAVDYDYDANGALIKDFNGQRFGYDAESHQKEFFSASNQTTTPDATYHYDGEGRRVKKIVGTEVTIFVYDAAGQLAAEYSTTVAPVQDAKISYLTTDHLGSPRIVTDAIGAVISRKDFTAFGEEVTSMQRVGGPTGNDYDTPTARQDYTGYEKDGESGLEFAQARYYNTGQGRFTSVDPLTASATIRNPQTFNRYSYTLNSPYKFTDPLGLMQQGVYSDTGFCGADSSYCSGSSFDPFAAEHEFRSRLVTLSGVRARSLDEKGKQVSITKRDRKALQKALNKLVPGTRVSKEGKISVPGDTGASAGGRLLRGLGSSGRNTTIVVNRSGDLATQGVDSSGRANSTNLVGGASDALVLWDPDAIALTEERVSPDRVVTARATPEITLAHELIHAHNRVRGDFGGLEFGYHFFPADGWLQMDVSQQRELRALGYGFNSAGDVTENQIRRELGLRSRASYGNRTSWRPQCGLNPASSFPC